MVMEDWTIKKLDVSVEFPDVLDLAALKGHGVQPNEELLPAEGKRICIFDRWVLTGFFKQEV